MPRPRPSIAAPRTAPPSRSAARRAARARPARNASADWSIAQPVGPLPSRTVRASVPPAETTNSPRPTAAAPHGLVPRRPHSAMAPTPRVTASATRATGQTRKRCPRPRPTQPMAATRATSRAANGRPVALAAARTSAAARVATVVTHASGTSERRAATASTRTAKPRMSAAATAGPTRRKRTTSSPISGSAMASAVVPWNTALTRRPRAPARSPRATSPSASARPAPAPTASGTTWRSVPARSR